MPVQGLCFVLAPKHTHSLQLRDHASDEIGKRVRQQSRRDHETIGITGCKDILQLLGNLPAGAAQLRNHDAFPVAPANVAQRHALIFCDTRCHGDQALVPELRRSSTGASRSSAARSVLEWADSVDKPTRGSTNALTRSRFSLASASVAPTNGMTAARTLQAPSGRPSRAASSRTPAVDRRMCSRAGEMLKITSAHLTAKVRPRSDAPAWMITGRPCGPAGMFSGPRDLK